MLTKSGGATVITIISLINDQNIRNLVLWFANDLEAIHEY